MENHLDQIRTELNLEREQHAKELADKTQEIEELKGLLDAVEGMQDLLTFQSHATAAGLSLSQWIKMTLQNSLKFNNVPVTKYAYDCLCKAASRKSTSLVGITQTQEFEKLILVALDNYNL